MRPAMQLASSPGIVSSVIVGSAVADRGRATRCVIALAHGCGQRGEAGASVQFAGVFRESRCAAR